GIRGFHVTGVQSCALRIFLFRVGIEVRGFQVLGTEYQVRGAKRFDQFLVDAAAGFLAAVVLAVVLLAVVFAAGFLAAVFAAGFLAAVLAAVLAAGFAAEVFAAGLSAGVSLLASVSFSGRNEVFQVASMSSSWS